MSVDVLVPWLEGDEHRTRALEWISDRYPWPVTLAPSPEPFCKGAALNAAISASSADVIIVADADVWCEGVESAVLAVICGVAAYAVPHRPEILRLSPEGTAAVLSGASWEDQPLDERPYPGVIGGGLLVAPREMLLDVPMDPRFVGFSREDYCWGMALRLLHGEPWRSEHPLLHLWHPPQERLDRKWGSVESYRLTQRYTAAKKNPGAMRALIAEGAG